MVSKFRIRLLPFKHWTRVEESVSNTLAYYTIYKSKFIEKQAYGQTLTGRILGQVFNSRCGRSSKFNIDS